MLPNKCCRASANKLAIVAAASRACASFGLHQKSSNKPVNPIARETCSGLTMTLGSKSMMRYIVTTVALLQFVGCASTPLPDPPANAIGCTLESPLNHPNIAGLIVMPKERADEFLSQLPVDARNIEFCWYQLRSGNLEARYGIDGFGYNRMTFIPAAGAPRNGGYEFEYRTGGWRFLRLNERLYMERH
jgi:hypothetical protein